MKCWATLVHVVVVIRQPAETQMPNATIAPNHIEVLI
jgi:hypothetical protein